MLHRQHGPKFIKGLYQGAETDRSRQLQVQARGAARDAALRPVQGVLHVTTTQYLPADRQGILFQAGHLPTGFQEPDLGQLQGVLQRPAGGIGLQEGLQGQLGRRGSHQAARGGSRNQPSLVQRLHRAHAESQPAARCQRQGGRATIATRLAVGHHRSGGHARRRQHRAPQAHGDPGEDHQEVLGQADHRVAPLQRRHAASKRVQLRLHGQDHQGLRERRVGRSGLGPGQGPRAADR